ncbi:MAG: hypothetical protein FJW66_05445 [Actinobacteria bacterium]|nr:hypothetical protein [Actinomycetota bacterium]
MRVLITGGYNYSCYAVAEKFAKEHHEVAVLVVLGAFMNILILIIILVLLYFEDRSGALFIVASFLISNVIFTYLTLNYSESVYSMGYFAASFFALIIAVIQLVFLKNINYHTFCGQPIIYKERKGLIGKMLVFLIPSKER